MSSLLIHSDPGSYLKAVSNRVDAPGISQNTAYMLGISSPRGFLSQLSVIHTDRGDRLAMTQSAASDKSPGRC